MKVPTSANRVAAIQGCKAVSELKGKAGAGETATALQPSHESIVVLMVVNAVKTKKPTESWALMYMLAVGRQLPPNSTNSVRSYLQMLLRTFAERCLTSGKSIKFDVLLHQQSWRSSNPNPAVEPKPTSLPMPDLA